MKKFIIGLAVFLIGIVSLNIPIIATAAPSAHSQTTHQTNTAILKKCGAEASDEDGGGIMCLLKEGLNIMTYIVGALGFAAIVWCGILYLTAGDNEEQVKKSKRRIFEIVVGVALFILANAIVQWLTGDTPDTGVLPTIYAFLG